MNRPGEGAARGACLALLCCLLGGGFMPPSGEVKSLSVGEVNSPLQRQWPPCLTGSAFFKSLPKSFPQPGPGDELSLRVLEEYGAIFVSQKVAPPLAVIFPDQNAVARWQASLSTEHAVLGGVQVRLQSAAMRALMKAREEAVQAHAGITPRGTDAAQRSYDDTLELWRSRVNPGLAHWVGKGRLKAAEAARIRNLPLRRQEPAILALEARGMYFSGDFSKSILLSVALPGASQHLSMLALDVDEHANPAVRRILERHGWFQTVRSDLPHFTYLGVEERQLPSLGLKMLKSGGRVFWVPDFACASTEEQVKRQSANGKTQK